MSRTLFAPIVFVCAIVVGCLVPSSATAASSSDVKGRVMCLNSGWPVGVWVDAKSSKDGFATHKALSASGGTAAWGTSSWSYRLNKGGTYRLKVGCGGTRADWKMTAASGDLTGSSSKKLVCNDVNPVLLAIWKATQRWKFDLSQGVAYGTCKLK